MSNMISGFIQTWHDLLAWLSALTLGQIWAKVYNPPNRYNLSIAAIVILARIPYYLKGFEDWRISRRTVNFPAELPEQVRDGWTGVSLDEPSLLSHEKQAGLLPSGTRSKGTGSYLTCYDPSTGQHIETIPLLSPAQIAQQFESAHLASIPWSKSTFPQRKMFLNSLKAWVLRDMDGIVKVACRDTGKTRVDAVFGEILTTLSKIDWLLSHGEKALAPSQRPGNLLLAHKVSKVHYQPLGLCLALVSWNYSFHNLLSPILAALFSGNSIVVKCSEQVAWSSRWYMNCVKSCLQACGLDPNVVELVVCLPDVAGQITTNPRVKHITFIGSEPVGRKVAAAAAEIMVPTCIELGGKDPAFLLPSAKLDEWTNHLMRGVYQSAGQNCIGIELVLVHRSKYDTLISNLLPKIQALRLGSDVGSLISSTPIPKLISTLEKARKQGATILSGGKPHTVSDCPGASYFEPTLVGDVKMDMELAKNELFAPVMSVVTYDNVDQAVEWLNNSRFGLGASVYGNNKKECRRVAERLQCGMVSINDFGVFYLNQAAPFGGFKASGHGRFGGEEGLRGLCNPKVIIEDRFFSWIRTSIPKPVAFPLPDETVSWPFLRGLVGLAYGTNLWARAKGLGGLIWASLHLKAIDTV